jgi:hypothetical protein
MTVAMSRDLTTTGQTQSTQRKIRINGSPAGDGIRIPEAVIALIFGVLGYLIVGRRDLS